MPAKRISSLNVVIGATIAPLANAVKGAGGILTGFAGQVKGITAGVAKLSGVGAVIGALAGGAGFGLLLHAQSEAIDNIGKLSDRLGVSTEDFAGLDHAANLAGISTEGLTGGLEFMLKNLAKGSEAGSELSESFKAIGLNAAELVNQKPAEAFSTIADALKRIENPAKRAYAATQIFGKSGQQLLPLLMSGSEGIKAAAKEAEALGLTFSRVDAANVEEANDALSRAKSAVSGVFRSLAIAFAPAMKSGADFLTGIGIRVVTAVKTHLPAAIDFIGRTYDRIAGVVRPGVDAFLGTTGRIYTGARDIFAKIYGVVAPPVMATVNFVRSAWPGILDTVTTVGGMILQVQREIWNRIAGFVGPILSSIGAVVAAHWQSYLQTIVGAGVAIYTAVAAVAVGVIDLASQLWDVVTGVWQWGSNLITGETADAGSATTTVFSDIGSVAQWMADTVTGALTIAGYAVKNWRAGVELAGLTVAYHVVKIGNQFAYVFTDVIPGLLTWFGNNWREIFTDVFNFTGTVFVNMAKNAGNFFKALFAWMSGDGFDFQWTGLTEGFESALKEMPAIAERVVGPMEGALGDAAKVAGDAYSDGLFQAMNDQDRRTRRLTGSITKGITSGIEDAVKAFRAPGVTVPVKVETIEPPKIPAPPPVKIGVDVDELDAAAKKANELKAIVVGTAEDQKLRYLAAAAAGTLPAELQPKPTRGQREPRSVFDVPDPTRNIRGPVARQEKSIFDVPGAKAPPVVIEMGPTAPSKSVFDVPALATVAPLIRDEGPGIFDRGIDTQAGFSGTVPPDAVFPDARPVDPPARVVRDMRDSADLVTQLKKLVDLTGDVKNNTRDIARKDPAAAAGSATLAVANF